MAYAQNVVNMRFFLFIVAVFLSSIQPTLQAQQKHCSEDCSCIVKGRVFDASTGETLPYASVQIKNTSIGVSANEEGYFKISQLCIEEFDLIISSIGYKSLTHHHDNDHDFTDVHLAQENLILESIVIEGEKENAVSSSSVVTSLDGKDLSVIKSESLGEVLSTITGVSTLKNGQNVVKPIIHGLHSNRVLIINNGVRHEGQSWGQEHAPEIDPSLAQRIKVIKGAAAVKYGPNALGGVIVIDAPVMELSSHLHGEGEIIGESNGRAIDGNILLQKGIDNYAFMVQSAGRYQGDLNAPNYNLTNTGMREYSLAIGTRYHTNHLDVRAFYNQISQELGILRGSVVGNLNDLSDAIVSEVPENTAPFSYTINTPNQQVAHQLVKLQTDYNLHHSLLKMQYSFQNNIRKEFDVRRGTNNEIPSINLKLVTHIFDAEWVHPQLGNWGGTLGGQWLYQDNNNIGGTNTIPFIPNYNNSRASLYLIEELSMKNAIIEFGARYDYQFTSVRGRESDGTPFIDEFIYNSLSGIIGLNKSLSEKSSLRINTSTAWRAPDVAELYSFGKHGAIIQYGMLRGEFNEHGVYETKIISNNNKEIKNELGVKIVGIYEMASAKSQLEVAPFVNYITDYFYAKPAGITNTVRGAFPYYVYDQTNVILSGIDATYIYAHSKRWKSKLAGSYLFAKDVLNKDFLIGVPPNKVSYDLSFSDIVGKSNAISFSLEPSYTFRQYLGSHRIITPEQFVEAEQEGTSIFANDKSNFDIKEVPDGYFLLNAKTDLTLKRMIIGLQLKNILNVSYRDYTNLMRYYADEVGFNAAVSLKIQI